MKKFKANKQEIRRSRVTVTHVRKFVEKVYFQCGQIISYKTQLLGSNKFQFVGQDI